MRSRLLHRVRALRRAYARRQRERERDVVALLQRLEPRLMLSATISGTVWQDSDGDGVRGAGEPGLGGWTVYVDTDNDAVMDAAELRQMTDANGGYTLMDVASGAQSIRIVRRPGWGQTTALTSATVNMLLPIADARELAYDATRNRLYATDANGEVARFDLNAWTMLAPIDVGYSLGGLDITPDGNELYVADRGVVGTKGSFRRVNLIDGTVTTLKFDHKNLGGFYEVAIGPDGKAKLSQTSIHGRVHEYDPATDAITEFSIGATATFSVERSADRQTFLFGATSSSPTELATFDSVTGQVIDSERDGGAFGPMVGINRNGTIVAIETTSGIKLQDRFFNTIGTLPNVTGGFVFDPVLDVIYTVNPTTDHIVAFNTNTLGQLYTIPIGENMSNSAFHGAGEMETSADGQFLFLITPGGVRVFSRSAVTQPGAFVESLTSSSVETGRDFGVLPAELGAVSGYLWVDANADGARDAGEAPQVGRTVYLDLDNDGQFDPGEPEQLTDSLGAYRFDGLLPGNYAVRTSLTPAMQLTYPLAYAAAAPSHVLDMADAQDIVYDPLRNRFYISTDTGLIRRWDVASQSMLSPINAGTLLNGMDISPDYLSLYVAEETASGGLGSVKKVNLDTGGVMSITFPLASQESGAWDVAIAGGRVYITGAGSNPSSSRVLDLATDLIISDGFSSSFIKTLDRSGDGALILGSRSNINPGAITLVDAATGNSLRALTMGETRGIPAALNFDGSMIAYQIAGTTFVLDKEFAGIALFPFLSSGVVFDPDRPVVWAVNTAADHVVAMDIARNRPLASMPVGLNVLAGETRFGPGGMAIGGGLVALITETGLHLWDIEAEAAASHVVTIGMGEVSVDNDFGVLMDAVTLALAPSSAHEDSGAGMVYTLTRGGDTSAALTVQFSIAGSASFGVDYTQSGADAFDGAAGAITFAPGASTATVTLIPVADTVVEPHETVLIAIAPGSGYSNASPGEHMAGILDDDATIVTIGRTLSTVIEDGDGQVVYTVTRDKTDGPLTVNLGVSGMAAFGEDYTQSGAATFTSDAATVEFADGVATATFTITPVADAIAELSETVTLSVSAGTGYVIGPAYSATATIANDDVPIVTLTIPTPARPENDNLHLSFNFKRNSTVGTLLVNFSVAGTASTSDHHDSGATTFTATAGTITFADGDDTHTLVIKPINDSVPEFDETVVITVTSGAGYAIGTPASATGTITNDDPPNVTLTGLNLTVTEDGTPNATFRFTRDLAAGPLTANFTVGGTASPVNDYTASGAATFTDASGTVTFADGSSTAEVIIDPTADAVNEALETVILTLTSGTGYVVDTPTTATANLSNDDAPAVTVAVAPASVTENGATNLVYTFTRTGFPVAGGNATTVNFSVGGAAVAGLDYVATGAAAFNSTVGSITLTGTGTTTTNTVTVNPAGDVSIEPGESVVLTVIAGTGYVPGNPAAATGTISNDDGAPLTLSVSIAPGSFSENGGAVGTVTRTGPTTSSLLVYLTTSDITELTVPATVTIPAGAASQTFAVTGSDDIFTDGNQTVTIEARTTPLPTPITLDPGFGTNGIAITPVRMGVQPPHAAMAIQADGKIIVAAQDADSARWRVARLLPNGDPDLTFGVGGSVTTAFSVTNPVPRRILIQADGKIIVGGKISTGVGTTALARYNADGTIDTTYGTAGIVNNAGITGWIEDMAFASDGKLLLAVRANGTSRFRAVRVGATGLVENVYVYNTINKSTATILPLADGRFLLAGDEVVARSNANGTLDATFGSGGTRSVTFNATNVNIDKLAFDTDGSIVVSAEVGASLDNTGDFGVSRLSFDGAIDTSFGIGGFAVVDLTGFDDTPTALILQPDRKILLSGDAEFVDGSFEAGFVRFHPTGALDNTFDDDGVYRKSVIPSVNERSFGAQLQPDGKLVSFHGWSTDYRVMRLIADTQPAAASTLVTVTDDEPVVTLALSIDSQSISENGGAAIGAVTRTGPTVSDLVVTLASSDMTAATVPATVTIPAGSSSVTFPITAVNDAVVDGTQPVTITAGYQPPPVGLDTSFGTNGLATTSLEMHIQSPRAAVAVQPDGKIIAAAEDANNSQWRVTRLLPGGGIDLSFGTAGVVTTPFATSFPVPYKVLVQPDGKIIVGGKISSGFGTSALVRYNADGSPDPTFGVNGVVDTSSIDGWIEDFDLESDGRLLLAIRFNGTVNFRAARVSADGVVESIYNYDLNSSATSIVALADGRFLLAGRSSVMMSTPSGVLDASFGVGGIQTVDFGMASVNITEMELDALGRIVVAATMSTGANTQDFVIARLLPGGGLDPLFGGGGFTITDFAGVDDAVTAMLLAPDGRILLTGTTETADSQYDAAIVRYTADGELDPTFDADGRFRQSILTSVNERLLDAALFPDGKLIALHGWANDFRVARYHTNAGPPLGAAAAVDVTDDDTVTNHSPTDVALSPAAVEENAAIGALAGNLSTTDPDAGDTHTYALVNGAGDADNTAFTIAGDQLLTAQVFDREVQSSYSVRIRATDAAGLHVERVFVISVADIDEIAPTVTGVFLDSSAWTEAYRGHMQDTGIGTEHGYAMLTGADQLKPLPWTINRLGVQFSEHVDVQQSDFSLLGVNTPDYADWLTGGTFNYDTETFTAVWTLVAPLGLDKLRLILSDRMTDGAGNQLDGEMADGISTSSGDGSPGGSFAFRFNLLPGNVNQDNGVLGDDVILVRNAQFQLTNSPNYSHLLDVNGSGSILGDDVVLVRNRQFTSLPAGEPGAGPHEIQAGIAAAEIVVATQNETLQPSVDADPLILTSGRGASAAAAFVRARHSIATMPPLFTRVARPVSAPPARHAPQWILSDQAIVWEPSSEPRSRLYFSTATFEAMRRGWAG